METDAKTSQLLVGTDKGCQAAITASPRAVRSALLGINEQKGLNLQHGNHKEPKRTPWSQLNPH